MFPEYRSRSSKLISFQERFNDCFELSMNGKALTYNSVEMNNILAYMQWLSIGVPTAESVNGRGVGSMDRKLVPNPANGKQMYAAKCASCHPFMTIPQSAENDLVSCLCVTRNRVPMLKRSVVCFLA